MAQKSFKQEDSKPIDYFKEVEAAKKQEESAVKHLVTALRPDMLPGSQAMPARKNLFQRINLKLTVGIIIGLVIIGLIWYSLIGPGRPLLEKRLAGLIEREPTNTQQVSPTPFRVTDEPPEASKTPFRSPTPKPTNTSASVIIASPTLFQAAKSPTLTITPSPTSSPTPSSQCRNSLSITLADVGQTMCVQGVVIETIANPTNFMVIFSTEKGAFYWVSYDLVWSKAELDTCYQIHGTIRQISNSPILVFGYSNL